MTNIFTIEELEGHANRYKDDEAAIVSGRFLREMIRHMRENEQLRKAIIKAHKESDNE